MAINKTAKEMASDARRVAESAQSKAALIAESSDREVEIELLIRQRYSLSQELALHRKHAMGTLDTETWEAYCGYVQECVEAVDRE